jgi:hypothetical protein
VRAASPPVAEPLAAGSGSPPVARAAAPVARAHRAARGSLRTELIGGQGFTSRGQARELTGGAGRRSPRTGGGASGGGHGGQQAKFGGCCKCMLHVFGMFLKNVCKCFVRMLQSRSKCCDVVTISDTCCMCINLDVAKVDLDVSLLQTSSFDVADAYCWVLQTLNFNVANVEFRCCSHVMFVSRRELLMLDVARNMSRCFLLCSLDSSHKICTHV